MKHLACIMDGNRRWAIENKVPLAYAYQQGIERICTVIDFALAEEIEYVSLFGFSVQNMGRTFVEKQLLYSVILGLSDRIISFIKERKVRVRCMGKRDYFPEEVRNFCDRLEMMTSQEVGLNVILLLGYGGQEDIVATTKLIAEQVALQKIVPEQVTDSFFKSHLLTSFLPDPELIIRTGKVKRLSNFFLYQAAYTELAFMDCLWPDITTEQLKVVFNDFSLIKRNFGL